MNYNTEMLLSTMAQFHIQFVIVYDENEILTDMGYHFMALNNVLRVIGF